MEELLSSMRKQHFSISVSELKIKSVDKARANSLSAKYGRGAFPFHTDFAFRAIPTTLHFTIEPYGSSYPEADLRFSI